MKTTETKSAKIGGRVPLPRVDSLDDDEVVRHVAALRAAANERSDAPRARLAGGRSSSVELEALAAELDNLATPGGVARPNPMELPSPINPEGSRKQSVETHRNLFCGHYDSCLDEAVKHGWNSFTCVRCALYTVGNEQPVTPGGVERFATQRKAS